LLLVSCGATEKPFEHQLEGKTMGTQYHIRIPFVSNSDVHNRLSSQHLRQLDKDIKVLLKAINQEMSTYIVDSSVSRFNQSQTTKWFSVSNNLLNVIENAQMISQASEGAFDITVMPFVNLWGFGVMQVDSIPSQQQINQARKKMGYQSLKTQPHFAAIRKQHPDLTIDLSAIAKGYAVDALALLLNERGIQHYLIEIGGEIRVRGKNKQNKAWRIAIEKPTPLNRSMQQGLILNNIAVATSGDYRNYYQREGKRYSHTINPKTGKPITHKLASVTVLDESSMIADAQATAIMVLGEVKGRAYAQEQDLMVYMIIHNGVGFSVWHNLPENVLMRSNGLE
jgi:thiamine biosynthesis lipoprotein